MKISFLFFFLCLFSLADEWGAIPEARLFSSKTGRMAAKILVNGSESECTVFRPNLSEKRWNEKVRWKTTLPLIPFWVFVSDSGTVVTIDQWEKLGGLRAIGIFREVRNEKGETNIESFYYPLGTLFTKLELQRLVKSTSGIHWFYYLPTLKKNWKENRLTSGFGRVEFVKGDKVEIDLGWKKLTLSMEKNEIQSTPPKFEE